MSFDLVPIASKVTAIPEFVNDNCGISAPGEDPQEVADAIKRLCDDPELFLKLAKNAADRVRRQTAPEYTIDKERQLIVPTRQIESHSDRSDGYYDTEGKCGSKVSGRRITT